MKKVFKRFVGTLTSAFVAAAPVLAGIRFDVHAEEMLPDDPIFGKLEFAEHENGVSVIGCRRTVRSVEIPAEVDGLPVTDIDSNAFFACTELRSVVIPDTVTAIGPNAFCDCAELAEIIIPDSVKTIDEYAFYGCRNLTSISIPESVTSIEWSAFAQCTSLTEVILPQHIEHIGFNAFADTPWLKDMYTHDSMLILNNTLFSAKELEWRPNVPGGVEKIADSAFESSEYLKKITFPDSLRSIGNYAFAECHYLSKVKLPKYLTEIGEAAFSDCIALNTINIPEGVTEIPARAFEYCSGMTYMVFPENVQYIGEKAMSSCESLEYVVINNPDCDIFDAEHTFANEYTDKYCFNGTIYGHAGSTAQLYAEKYDIDFGVIGDVNADCEFTVSDLVFAEKYLLGSGDLLDWRAADFNNDDKFDIFDFIILRQNLIV